MKVGEFQKAIDVKPNAYSSFMTQNGPEKGKDSTVFLSAWAFFKKREMLGIKPTPAKKKAAAAKGKDPMPNVDDIELDGEKDGEVPIYDTCDEIRRKINAHLKKPGVTAAAFCRAMAGSFKKAPRKISSAQLSAFRSKKGPFAGNASGVFYGAYVYFEKLRIKEVKEEAGDGGNSWTEGAGKETYDGQFSPCRSDERPVVDSYGIFSIMKV
ncbi:hypothetical protein IAQ61_011565, partial [Plenodomus lingam]|uniref:uncharacterized protein n=1 Tax=Leptosphaeria maculans TaxID=5022 RepID=UPI0033234D9A